MGIEGVGKQALMFSQRKEKHEPPIPPNTSTYSLESSVDHPQFQRLPEKPVELEKHVQR